MKDLRAPDAYVIKPDLDGLLGSIIQFVSLAENATAKIIPFGRKMFSPPFSFEPGSLICGLEDMNTEPSKEEERQDPAPQAEVEFAVNPNRWSIGVQSSVSEFQQHRWGESPPAFDSLFKDALLR
jgi:hypothetical protein